MGKLLLVDDEEEFLDSLRASLETAGFDVLTAPNAFEALRIIKNIKEPIDCVLTDYRMPEMRGDELAFAIKHNTGIPVVIMTGDNSVSAEVLFKAGISGVINKPFDAEHFIEFLRNNDLQVEVSKQRKFLRQKVNQASQRIQLTNGRDTVEGDILNMSNGGIGVCLDRAMEPMSTLQFILQIDGVEVKGYMHCRWRAMLGERLNAGFEFDSLTKKSLSNNSDFIKWVTINQAS
ncbi:MAG TPA: response regulator [Oligoflexus sp.]|uniref:response regulator n=1 Tax=Oligoflexus sp. TaxID=1971216 RepID=UPI002D5AD2FD|nr:response regulator [Oligoflexus sp.]HYX38186.1 response regulator [Oligoflexus sp.]